MSETEKIKKKGLLPRTEMIILIVLLGFFVLWALKQCSNDLKVAETEVEMNEVVVDTPDNQAIIESIRTDTFEIVKEVTVLYVNINNLKLRSSPNLKSDVVEELSLGSKVKFAGEVTDSLFTINLGKREVTEPYVKVKTWKGIEGWVYGAGVDYYKKKVEGTY
jgi:hypothetical protein